MIEADLTARFYSRPVGIPDTHSLKHMNEAQIDKASKDFEGLFIGMMLEHMFGDSLGTEAFGDKESADIYKGMITGEYGKEIARAGGIGVAAYVKAELLKLQETGV